MASIITGILNSTVGLLLNKVRDKTADKLKDGDVTDVKIREIIVRELNDVEAKIDGLSRSYLLTSYDFLREGVNLLKVWLDKSEAKQKAVLSETCGDGSETSAKPSNVESGVLTEALTLGQAMGKVKINSDKELETAKKRFEDARKEATKTFHNEALSIKDRIFAVKLRIVAELLECLESPETAITNCLPFLETLHHLPAIRELFSVHINGGVRSIVSKAERVENVKSVMLINYVLFQFVLQFSSKYCSPRTWPTIELDNRSFRPILDWEEISTRRLWGEEFIKPPNKVSLDKETDNFFSRVMAVNSHGEIISYQPGGDIFVASRAGAVKMLTLNYPEDGEVNWRCFEALAVDSSNNIYVVMRLETSTEESGVVKSHVLYVFDENDNVKQNCTLHFLDAGYPGSVGIAINENNNIIIKDRSHVYVWDNAGELKHKFRGDTALFCSVTTSDNNSILLPSKDLEAVHRYTEKGYLVSRIKVPEGHKVCGVAFHHVIRKIMVLTFIWGSGSCVLHCYSAAGELENSTFLRKKSEHEDPQIKSHPSGPVVVVWGRSFTFI